MRTLLFFLVCIPLRVAIALLAPLVVPWVALGLVPPAIGWIALSLGLWVRPRGAFGEAWWAPVRSVHAALYCIAAACAVLAPRRAVAIPLLVDACLAVVLAVSRDVASG
jgi:hypothetical protein